MKEQKLITKLFEGEYDGVGVLVPDDDEYIAAYNKTHENIEYFYNLLPESERSKFDDFISDFHLMNKHMNRLWYKEGLNFGLTLMKEINE